MLHFRSWMSRPFREGWLCEKPKSTVFSWDGHFLGPVGIENARNVFHKFSWPVFIPTSTDFPWFLLSINWVSQSSGCCFNYIDIGFHTSNPRISRSHLEGHYVTLVDTCSRLTLRSPLMGVVLPPTHLKFEMLFASVEKTSPSIDVKKLCKKVSSLDISRK